MRPKFRPLCLCFVLAVGQPALAADFALRKSEGGGFVIERNGLATKQSAHGLATIAELIPLLKQDGATPEKIDFAAGKKLEGTYTVIVGRDDGTLGRYEGAVDVIMFSAPETMTIAGDLTTYSGAVVFALKIDNAGSAAAVQRFETGAISLALTRKSL